MRALFAAISRLRRTSFAGTLWLTPMRLQPGRAVPSRRERSCPLAPTIENALGQTIAYADLMNLLGPLDERPDEDAMIRAHWLAIGHVFDDALLCLGTLQTDRLPEEGRRLMAWCLAGTGDWPQLESMLDSEQTAEACARVWLLQGPLNRFDEGLDLRVELCHRGDFQPDNLWWRDTEDQLEATGDWSRLIQLLTEFDDTHLPEVLTLERRSRGIRGALEFLPADQALPLAFQWMGEGACPEVDFEVVAIVAAEHGAQAYERLALAELTRMEHTAPGLLRRRAILEHGAGDYDAWRVTLAQLRSQGDASASELFELLMLADSVPEQDELPTLCAEWLANGGASPCTDEDRERLFGMLDAVVGQAAEASWRCLVDAFPESARPLRALLAGAESRDDRSEELSLLQRLTRLDGAARPSDWERMAELQEAGEALNDALFRSDKGLRT